MTVAAEPAAPAARPLTAALGALRGPALVTLAVLVMWQLAHELAGDVAITAPAPTLAHLVEMIGQVRAAEEFPASMAADRMGVVRRFRCEGLGDFQGGY